MTDIPQSCIALRAKIPAGRPDLDSGGGVYDRLAVIRIAKELIAKAMDPKIEAVRIELEPNGLGISIATRR